MKIKVAKDISYINEIVQIHLDTFQGFFLSFLGKGFLKQLYIGFIEHENSDILIAVNNNKILGFLAYSEDISLFYKFLLKKKLFLFAWYAFISFLKKPTIFLRLLVALQKSNDVKRNEAYVELSSIGVRQEYKDKGIGSALINSLKSRVNFNKFAYISLETDSENNERVNSFYKKNHFKLVKTYVTRQGRKMNEFHYYKDI